MDFRFAEPAAPIPFVATTATIDEFLEAARRPEPYDDDGGAALLADFDQRFAGNRSDLTPAQRGGYLLMRARVQTFLGNLADAETLLVEAVEVLTDSGDEPSRQQALARLGGLLCVTKRDAEGLPMLVAATDYMLTHGGPAERRDAHRKLTIAYSTLGRAKEAYFWLERAVESADRVADPRAEERLALLRAQALMSLRHPDAAAAVADARQVCRASGFRSGWSRSSLMAARLAATRNDVEATVAACEDAIATATNGMVLRIAKVVRARTLATTPRAGEVIDDLIEAIALAPPESADPLHRALSIAYHNAGYHGEAADLLSDRLSAADPLDATVEPLRKVLAEAFDKLGRHGPAAAQWDLYAGSAAHRGDLRRAGAAYMLSAVQYGKLNERRLTAERFGSAADAFERHGEMPKAFKAAVISASAFIAAGDYPDAGAQMTVVRRLNLLLPPDDQELRKERAEMARNESILLQQQGRLEEAVAWSARAAGEAYAVGGASAQATALNHGRLLLRVHRPAEAEPALRWTVTTASGPTQRSAAILLVKALGELGRKSEAKRIVRQFRL